MRENGGEKNAELAASAKRQKKHRGSKQPGEKLSVASASGGNGRRHERHQPAGGVAA